MGLPDRLYLLVSPLPILGYLAASAYVNRFEGWGAWAAAPILLVPLALSLALGLLGIFLSFRSRHDRAAFLKLGLATLLAASVVVVVALRASFAAATGNDQWDAQPYLDAAKQAEQRAKLFRESARLGPVAHQLSCLAEQAYIPAEYGAAYERARFVVPLELTQSGRYRIRLSYSSDLNQRRSGLDSEQVLDLAEGRHEIGFDYAFGRTWGYFVEAPASSIEIRVDRYASIRELYGDSASVLDEDIDRQAFRNVIFRTDRLDGIANVFTDTVGSLVCPEQPQGPPPVDDGPR